MRDEEGEEGTSEEEPAGRALGMVVGKLGHVEVLHLMGEEMACALADSMQTSDWIHNLQMLNLKGLIRVRVRVSVRVRVTVLIWAAVPSFSVLSVQATAFNAKPAPRW